MGNHLHTSYIACLWCDTSESGENWDWWQNKSISAFTGKIMGIAFILGVLSVPIKQQKSPLKKPSWDCANSVVIYTHAHCASNRINVWWFGRCCFASECLKLGEICSLWAQSHPQARGVSWDRELTFLLQGWSTVIRRNLLLFSPQRLCISAALTDSNGNYGCSLTFSCAKIQPHTVLLFIKEDQALYNC